MIFKDEEKKKKEDLEESVRKYAEVQQIIAGYVEEQEKKKERNPDYKPNDIDEKREFAGNVLGELRKIEDVARIQDIDMDPQIDVTRSIQYQEGLVTRLGALNGCDKDKKKMAKMSR